MDFPKSVPGVGLVNGKFIDEDPLAATPGSLIPSAWGNAVTQEVLKVIEDAGLVPAEEDNTQLSQAIEKLVSDVAIEFATQEEAEEGTESSKAMSPLRVFQAIAKKITQATEGAFGWAKIATQAQTNSGADDTTIVTPKKLGVWFAARGQASEANIGVAKMATMTQARAGVDDTTIITPKKLNAIDPWTLIPIGVPVAVLYEVAGSIPPTDNANYRYIKLTAGDPYNTGVLVSETTTGSVPLVVSTATISQAGSALNGLSVNLINTERRVLRAGNALTVENDTAQGHDHSSGWWTADNGSSQRPTYTPGTPAEPLAGRVVESSANNYSPRYQQRTGPVIADATNGTPRFGIETRAKNIGVTYYLRIK